MRGAGVGAAAGAWLERPASSDADAAPRRQHANTGVPLAQALVGTGFSYSADRRAAQAEVLRSLLPQVRDIRRGGSAALDLCSVASGRLDALYERHLNPWDYAAGALIAREAGAIVAGLHGAGESPQLLIASAPGLFEQLHAALAEAQVLPVGGQE